jgi:hypothetical protein
MATQSRVPGAASSEVDFELERFERTSEDRIEISGRWFGLRGRRFVRPVLNLHTGGSRRRAIALLEHKPWAANDGQTWLAAFAWPEGAGEVESAELEVGPGLVVELPAPGGTPNTAGRVSALRPHVPTPPVTAFRPPEEDARGGGDGESRRRERASGRGSDRGEADGGTGSRAPARVAHPPRDVMTAARAERDEAIAARDASERERIAALNDRDDALSRRDAALRDVDRAITERDEAVAERDRMKSELERVTRERDVADAERKRTMQDSEAVERARDQAAAERDAARSELSRALPAREQAIRERDAEAARADQAESERDTAYAERKSAVAQRDRARRERDRAMRAAGVEPPTESPHLAPAPLRQRQPSAAARGTGEQSADKAREAPGPAPGADGAGDVGRGRAAGAAASPGDGSSTEPVTAVAEVSRSARPPGATPPGTPLPSRPVKRIGATPTGPMPEPKPLLTPVDSGRPRRLSRTRRPPSAPARWAVRIAVLLLLVAIGIVLVLLLGSAL